MGCNCHKNHRRPLGSGGAAARTAPGANIVNPAAPPATPRQQPQQPAQQPAQQNTSGSVTSFQLRGTDGRTQSFGSRLERDAARVRASNR